MHWSFHWQLWKHCQRPPNISGILKRSTKNVWSDYSAKIRQVHLILTQMGWRVTYLKPSCVSQRCQKVPCAKTQEEWERFYNRREIKVILEDQPVWMWGGWSWGYWWLFPLITGFAVTWNNAREKQHTMKTKNRMMEGACVRRAMLSIEQMLQKSVDHRCMYSHKSRHCIRSLKVSRMPLRFYTSC